MPNMRTSIRTFVVSIFINIPVKSNTVHNIPYMPRPGTACCSTGTNIWFITVYPIIFLPIIKTAKIDVADGIIAITKMNTCSIAIKEGEACLSSHVRNSAANASTIKMFATRVIPAVHENPIVSTRNIRILVNSMLAPSSPSCAALPFALERSAG